MILKKNVACIDYSCPAMPIICMLFLLLQPDTSRFSQSIEQLTLRRHVLEQQPSGFKRDTSLIRVLDSCARYWILSGQPIRASESLRRGEVICQQRNWPLGQALLRYRKGHYQTLLRNASQAKKYFMEAIPRLKQLNQTHFLLLAYVQMGASEIDRDGTDTTGIGTTIRYLQEGLAISEQSPNRESYAALCFRLSRAYLLVKDYNEALFFVDASWKESQRMGYNTLPFYDALVYSICYTHLNDEVHFRPAWSHCRAFLTKLNTLDSYEFYLASAGINQYHGNYEQTLTDGKRALRYADSLQSPVRRLQIHRILVNTYKKLNQPTLALHELEEIKQLEDSTQRQRSSVALAELQIRYDTRLKQKEIDRLTIQHQRDQAGFLAGGLLILSLALGYIVYSNRQLRQKNRAILTAQLQGQTLERQRVAADLHDNLGTTLSALHWNLEALDKTGLTATEQAVYANISQQVDQAYNDVRLLSHNLLPDELAKRGLGAALRQLVDKLNRGTLTHFQLTDAGGLPRFHPQTEFELYSICLELFNNTLKHANATESHVDLIQQNDTLHLTISDNGVGLIQQGKEGRGLQNVAARVAAMDGQWEVESDVEKGVKHKITVPIRAANQVS